MKLPWLVSQCAALFTIICYYNFELIRSHWEHESICRHSLTHSIALLYRLLNVVHPKPLINIEKTILNFLHLFYIVCKIAIDRSCTLSNLYRGLEEMRKEWTGRKGSLTVWLPLTIWCIAFNTSAVFPFSPFFFFFFHLLFLLFIYFFSLAQNSIRLHKMLLDTRRVHAPLFMPNIIIVYWVDMFTICFP